MKQISSKEVFKMLAEGKDLSNIYAGDPNDVQFTIIGSFITFNNIIGMTMNNMMDPETIFLDISKNENK